MKQKGRFSSIFGSFEKERVKTMAGRTAVFLMVAAAATVSCVPAQGLGKGDSVTASDGVDESWWSSKPPMLARPPPIGDTNKKPCSWSVRRRMARLEKRAQVPDSEYKGFWEGYCDSKGQPVDAYIPCDCDKFFACTDQFINPFMMEVKNYCNAMNPSRMCFEDTCCSKSKGFCANSNRVRNQP